MYEPLQAQIEKTTRNLERGETRRSDRIFLNHILEELSFILNTDTLQGSYVERAEALEVIFGATNQLVEDGLE